MGLVPGLKPNRTLEAFNHGKATYYACRPKGQTRPKALRNFGRPLADLIVQPSGHKSWAYHYKFRGAPRKLTIGPYPAIDLKQARALAQKARAEVATGCDPAADKQAARRAPKPDHDTIEARVAAYLTHAKARTREFTWAEISRILQRELIPAWQGRGLSSIGKSDVRALLASIMERGSPVMANRIRTAASGLFSWAVEQDMI